MKKVFTDKSTVAHLWANKCQSDATTTGRNYYFHNDTIYSYGSHFPIAKHIKNEAGEAAILFTTRSYSNTTSKQIAVTYQACRNQNIIFCTYPDQYRHKENVEAWEKKIEYQAQKLLKAKKPELYLNEIDRISYQAKKYLSYFDIQPGVVLTELMNITNKDKYKEFSENRAKIEKIEAANKQKELLKAHKKQLIKFLNFEIDRINIDIKKDFLRFNKESKRIETTQKVLIPFEAGKKLFEALENDLLKINDEILSYSVNYIDKKTVKIGCHTFDKKHLLSFGKKIFA